MITATDVKGYTFQSKLLQHGRPTPQAGSGLTTMLNPNGTLASESWKLMAIWGAVLAVAAGLSLAHPVLFFVVALLGIPVWLMTIPVIGFWSASQATYRLLPPMSSAWWKINPSAGNYFVRSLVGFVALPLVLVGLAVYWIAKASHVLEVSAGRKSKDASTRKANEYMELGKRDYWFRAYREAKRQDLSKADFDRFLTISTLGVLVPAIQFRQTWGSELKDVPNQECSRIVDDLTALYGLPKKQ